MNQLKALVAMCCFLPYCLLADDGTGNAACPVTPADITHCNAAGALLPDLMTVVPKHLQIQNQQKKEWLRFSNGIANLGQGPWWLEPEFPNMNTGSSCQGAYQLVTAPEHFPNRHIIPTDTEIPASVGTYLSRCQKGKFDFHETHNHWHIANVGSFKICRYQDFVVNTGVNTNCAPVLRPQEPPSHVDPAIGIKFTFCLIDWYKIADNAPQSDPTRNYFVCETGYQGIAPGWVDQYHHSTDGQSIDITGIGANRYVLVSTVNSPLFGQPVFEESNTENNSAWVVFDLKRDSAGNAIVSVVADVCDSPFDYRTNQLQPVAEAFAAAYPDGTQDFADRIMHDMCGNKRVNR